MRRVSSLVVLVFLAALVLPVAVPAAQTETEDGDAIVVISGDVTVPRGQTVDGVFIVSGDLKLLGHVDGDVVLASGDALVSGRIDGSLVTIGGQARLLPRAFIKGNVHYGDERPIVAGAAIVRGDVSKENGFDSVDFLPFISVFLFWLAAGISMAILGVLLLLIAPRAAEAIAARSRERIGPVIGIGFAVAIALPIAAAIAAVTLVGLPLGFIAGLAAVIFGLGLIGAAIGAARERPEPAPNPGT